MKKYFFLLFEVLLLSSLLIGCAHHTTNDEDTISNLLLKRYIDLSSKERTEFVALVNEESGETQSFKFFDDPDGYIPDFATSYGKFGKNSVWFIPGNLTMVDVKEVGGYKFIHSSSFAIKVFASGEILDLNDAYQKRVLTQQDIAELYSLHKQFEIHFFDGAFLYKDYE